MTLANKIASLLTSLTPGQIGAPVPQDRERAQAPSARSARSAAEWVAWGAGLALGLMVGVLLGWLVWG